MRQYSFPVIIRDSEAALKAKILSINILYIKNIYISSTEKCISFVMSALMRIYL